jgi:endonuclease-3
LSGDCLEIERPLTAAEVLTLEIMVRLEARYGVQQWHTRLDPLDELIACILSQHTSDVNSLRAFAQLKDHYPTWETAAQAPVEDLADSIRCGGLAESKAPRIQNVLRTIETEHGRMDLDFLYALPDAEARAYLMSLPGVGPKTAAIVLCFAMGRPVLPVDTHVFRVAWRIGLIEKRIGEARAHDALQAQIVPEMAYRFHVALITHGRQTCKALAPRCTDCPLAIDLCRYYAEQAASETD